MSSSVEELKHRSRSVESSGVTGKDRAAVVDIYYSEFDPINLIVMQLRLILPRMNCPADSVGGATASMSLSSYADISSPDAPRPVQIVVAKPDHTFDLDHEALQVGTYVAGSINFFGL